MTEPTANVAATHTRETLETTARTFARLAETARRLGEAEQAARLDALAQKAIARAERLSRRGELAAPDEPPARAQPGRSARVLLVDDHELPREALRSVLAAESDLLVVGEAEDGNAAVRLARELRPDLVLMDIRLPGLDGIEATRRITAEQPRVKVVMLTSYEQRPIVADGLRAGAAGYLLKGASKQEVLATMRAALAGERRVQGSLAADLLQDAPETGTSGTLPEGLSEREAEVLRLMAEGSTNEAIGRKLHLSVNTVKTHVRHLLQKLDAPDRASAVARGAALHLLDGPDRGSG